MFCKNCGKELLNGAKFCTVCGATQDTSVSNAAPSYQSPQPAAVNNDVYQALQAEANYQTYKKAKKKKKQIIIALLLVNILCIASLVGYSYYDWINRDYYTMLSKKVRAEIGEAAVWESTYIYDDDTVLCIYGTVTVYDAEEYDVEALKAAAEASGEEITVYEELTPEGAAYCLHYSFDGLSEDEEAAETAAEIFDVPTKDGKISMKEAEEAAHEKGYSVGGEMPHTISNPNKRKSKEDD